MEHLAALHENQKRQPPSQSITSSMGSKAGWCRGLHITPCGWRGTEAEPDNSNKISIQNFKLLQKTTCCCASPWEQEATAELSIVYNKIIIFFQWKWSLAEGPHRHQDAAQTAGSRLVGFSMWRNSLRGMGELKVLPEKHQWFYPSTAGRLCDPWAVTSISTPVSAGNSHCRDTQNARVALENFSPPEQKG